jgi:serine protease
VRKSITILLFLFALIFTPYASAKNYRYIVKHSSGEMFKAKSVREKNIIIEASSAVDALKIATSSGLAVVNIDEDIMLYRLGSANDTYFSDQWSLNEETGGINILDAWDEHIGSTDTVVAVLDTGILEHKDLKDRVLPGYDFVSSLSDARDGDGRDSDPTDMGDYVLSSDLCPNSFSTNDSSWHGTHVAGTIVASTNNSRGIAGVDQRAMLLPVRVLGKCGGRLSDITDAIVWAAGGSVSGVPDNQNPADVINLSLGAFGSCTSTMQSAINFANSKGVVVVVAAGNEGLNLDWRPFIPATCRGVITVGASNRSGTFTSYSNRGEFVDISAPGGDIRGSIVSLSNSGDTVVDEDAYKELMGTSMATPHVSGVASLIHAANPELYPAQVEDIIKRSYKAISCPRGQCGSGLIDAHEAILLARGTSPDPNYTAIEPISFDEGGIDNLGDDRFVSHEEESVGCGSVNFIDGSNGGPGSGPNNMNFILTLLLGFMISLISIKKNIKNNLKRVFVRLIV